MKPYITRQAWRPNCPCCVTKQGHGHPGHSTETTIRAKRGGKKAVRQAARKDIQERYVEG